MLISYSILSYFLFQCNEQVKDLLNNQASAANATLEVRESPDGAYICNLKQHDVSSERDAIALMERASKRRAKGSTKMNPNSSRSHAICTLTVTIAPDGESREEEDDGDIRPRSSTTSSSSSSSSDHAGMKAKLTFVDLAGSEGNKNTRDARQAEEGKNINKGLLQLGNVIRALSEQQRNGGGSQKQHIPYRNSKLTRLLKDSLGGEIVYFLYYL